MGKRGGFLFRVFLNTVYVTVLSVIYMCVALTIANDCKDQAAGEGMQGKKCVQNKPRLLMDKRVTFRLLNIRLLHSRWINWKRRSAPRLTRQSNETTWVFGFRSAHYSVAPSHCLVLFFVRDVLYLDTCIDVSFPRVYNNRTCTMCPFLAFRTNIIFVANCNLYCV